MKFSKSTQLKRLIRKEAYDGLYKLLYTEQAYNYNFGVQTVQNIIGRPSSLIWSIHRLILENVIDYSL